MLCSHQLRLDHLNLQYIDQKWFVLPMADRYVTTNYTLLSDCSAIQFQTYDSLQERSRCLHQLAKMVLRLFFSLQLKEMHRKTQATQYTKVKFESCLKDTTIFSTRHLAQGYHVGQPLHFLIQISSHQ